MRLHWLLLILFVAPPAVSAHEEDEPILTASDLRDWCRQESEARFIAAGSTPYNWTASHIERGNVLHVDGKWRVDGEEVRVVCRVARGARRRYAVLELHPVG